MFFKSFCPDGGIGRHAGLRSQCFGVRVRISLGAPNASMVKSVYTADLKSAAARRDGSSPSTRTTK